MKKLTAQELRMGNWVYYRNYLTGDEMMDAQERGETEKPYNVHTINSMSIFNIDSGGNDYEPIPLTEEWLLKFGAVKTWDSFNSCDHWVINYNGDMTVITFSFEYGCDQMVNDLEFVHQLQNLYYSITGEELTIKF